MTVVVGGSNACSVGRFVCEGGCWSWLLVVVALVMASVVLSSPPPPTYLLMLSSMSSCCDVRASYSRKQIMQKSVVRVWARLWGEGHALA